MIKLASVIPSVFIKESAGDPIKLVQLLGKNFNRVANNARKSTGKNWGLADMDLITPGVQHGSSGSLRRNLRDMSDWAREIKNAPKFSPERNQFAQAVRAMRNQGIQVPNSYDTFTRFGQKMHPMTAKNLKANTDIIPANTSLTSTGRTSATSSNNQLIDPSKNPIYAMPSGKKIPRKRGPMYEAEVVSETARPAQKQTTAVSAPTSAGSQTQYSLTAKNPSTPAEEAGAGKLSFLERFRAKFNNPAVAAGTAAGATAIPSYLIGSNLGESAGMEQGLDAGAYQGYMKAMQDAQQRYDNQGLLDRIIGNNPF